MSPPAGRGCRRADTHRHRKAGATAASTALPPWPQDIGADFARQFLLAPPPCRFRGDAVERRPAAGGALEAACSWAIVGAQVATSTATATKILRQIVAHSSSELLPRLTPVRHVAKRSHCLRMLYAIGIGRQNACS